MGRRTRGWLKGNNRKFIEIVGNSGKQMETEVKRRKEREAE